MKRGLPILFALSLSAIVGVACAGVADKSDPPGASSRQALLIANAGYADDHVPLRHPVTDARALTDELRRAGFDVVVGEDLTKQAMQNAIADFTTRIRPGSAALIFFSGHGIQLERQNYLIPINAQIWSEADVRRDGIPMESVLADMDRSGARVKLVIIDASRANPFERRFRGFSAGLTSINVSQGTLIMYAAAPGKTANDGPGENGLLVAELLKEIRSTDNTAEQVFVSAARSVARASGGERVPWVASSLAGDFHLTGPSVVGKPLQERTVTTSIRDPASNQQAAEGGRDCPPPADKAWSGSLASHPSGPCATLAREELAKLESAPGYRPVNDRATFALSSSQPAEGVSAQSSEPEIPRLLVQGSGGKRGEPVPLGVTLHGRADGAIITVTGLVPGMTLSTGVPVGTNAWKVPAADLANTWISHNDFIDAVDLMVELHLADATIADRQPIHIDWRPVTAAVTPQLPAVAPPPKAVPAPHQLDPEEVAMLLDRGEHFIANGDLAAARLVLERAAKSGQAQAAFMLATTYDPAILRERKVYGFADDVVIARSWYEKAQEFGSAEASRRLELLANGVR
jgi:Caspase domain